MNIIPAKYHEIPCYRTYIVLPGTPEQAAATYERKIGSKPDTIYLVKMYPGEYTVNYMEVST